MQILIPARRGWPKASTPSSATRMSSLGPPESLTMGTTPAGSGSCTSLVPRLVCTLPCSWAIRLLLLAQQPAPLHRLVGFQAVFSGRANPWISPDAAGRPKGNLAHPLPCTARWRCQSARPPWCAGRPRRRPAATSPGHLRRTGQGSRATGGSWNSVGRPELLTIECRLRRPAAFHLDSASIKRCSTAAINCTGIWLYWSALVTRVPKAVELD